jgi:outer membrane protein OmpA-like peptidoglycan-associated protein
MAAAPLAAQSPGTVELGAFGRYTAFDATLALKNRLGGGGRFGVFVVPNLEVEGTGSWTGTEVEGSGADVSYLPFHARLVYNLPVHERAAVLIGAGLVHTQYQNTADASDDGANGLLGLRFWLSDAVSGRVEGLLDYIPAPTNGAGNNVNWGAQAGLSVFLGGRAADADGDGVRDDRDACPGTSMGEAVDARGCPLDSDNDGVRDSGDRCPSTPAGEVVDSSGCPRDSDGDGVRDSADRCANTPAGVSVDASGCPTDADGDGVADARDRCPNTPAGAAVDANGCPRDSDGDGVADAQDRCPNTPAGATVDANGCPGDADGDGVPDGIDRCGDTAPGTEVDANGCPVLFEEDVVRIVLEGVTFATNSADLTAEARTVLDRVAASLRGNLEVRVEVGGHTDATGSREYNLQLSQSRAESVVAYLVQQGVASDRMEARGYGPDNPVADKATREGRAQNRRVELRRTDQ